MYAPWISLYKYKIIAYDIKTKGTQTNKLKSPASQPMQNPLQLQT